MKRTFSAVASAFLVSLLTGCGPGPGASQEFRLPEGEASKGKTAFVELKCYTCHIVPGSELPPPSQTVSSPVVLGGEVARVKTYEELVTAMIHPSHNLSAQLQKEWMRDGQLSPMGNFNHVMTVSQLIDMAAFLQPHYKLIEPGGIY